MEEINKDLTVCERVTRGVPGQPGILVRAGESSIRVGDGDQAATHVGAGEPAIQAGDGDQAAINIDAGKSSARGSRKGDRLSTHVGASQSSIRDGPGQLSVRGREDDDRAVIIGNAFF